MTEPLPPLAEIGDFTVRLGRSLDGGANDGPEHARAAAAIYDASTYVRDVVDKTWTGDEGDEAPPQVMPIICAMALRVFRNPDGLSSETIGEYTWRGADGTPAGIYLTEIERSVIVRCRDKTKRFGLWTISTSESVPNTVMVDVDGSEPFPLYDAENDPVIRGIPSDQLGGNLVDAYEDDNKEVLGANDWLT